MPMKSVFFWRKGDSEGKYVCFGDLEGWLDGRDFRLRVVMTCLGKGSRPLFPLPVFPLGLQKSGLRGPTEHRVWWPWLACLSRPGVPFSSCVPPSVAPAWAAGTAVHHGSYYVHRNASSPMSL